MPAVAFYHPDKPNAEARMFSPRKIQDLKAWYKGARAVLPCIPRLEDSDWRITKEYADMNYVKFELTNSIGQQAWITIDRRKPSF
jgi:hypothetical protein